LKMPQLHTATFLMMVLMAGCGMWHGEKHEGETSGLASDSAWSAVMIEAAFPLRLDEVDFEKAVFCHAEDNIEARIKQTVNDYYTRSCNADSLHTPADVYINTLRLRDSLQTVFVVLLRHYPTSNLDSRILFYNHRTGAFVGGAIDFKIYALYDLEKGRIKRSYLKELLEINSPELEQLDYNGDGIMDYRATRLYHNGTINAIRTCVLSVGDRSIDTLYYKETPFSLAP
jgi:hypothetical protein